MEGECTRASVSASEGEEETKKEKHGCGHLLSDVAGLYRRRPVPERQRQFTSVISKFPKLVRWRCAVSHKAPVLYDVPRTSQGYDKPTFCTDRDGERRGIHDIRRPRDWC